MTTAAESNRLRQAKWRAKNIEKAKAKSLSHYQNNKEAYQRRSTQWKKDNPERLRPGRRKNSQKRRALARNAFVSEVVDIEIFKRDNWICQLCLLPVDAELKCPNPKSKSLDHIVPLSKGGTHEPSNVQLAHISCNSSKNNRLTVTVYVP